MQLDNQTMLKQPTKLFPVL